MNTNYILLSEKKTRKRKSGECFYFSFKNGDTFLGVILQVGLDWGIWYEKKLVTLFFKNRLLKEKIYDEDYLNDIISNYENLAMPPRIMDNSGWNFGYYKSFGQVDVHNVIGYFDDVTFYNNAFGYVQNLNEEIVQVNNLYLCGINSIANCYGIETLMEITMDYDFVEQPNEIFKPYSYISTLISENNIKLPIPDWCNKAKERLMYSQCGMKLIINNQQIKKNMETTGGKEILEHEYVQIHTNGSGNIVLLFEDEKEKPLAVGQKMYEINEDAYMNGYNWDAFFNYYLAEKAPDILESIDSDPEAGTYAAYFEESKENEKKAKRFADIIISLIENEEEIYKIVREKGDEIEWD